MRIVQIAVIPESETNWARVIALGEDGIAYYMEFRNCWRGVDTKWAPLPPLDSSVE